jgi:DNA repair protein RecO (recombination protein O)
VSTRSVQRPPTLAYVLHAHDWSESSLIVDLFTRDFGRVSAVAKGAKRPHSQLRPVLMPFHQIVVGFGAKTGPEVEVWLLRLAEWGGGPAWPGGAALLPAFYANELLMRLLPRHDQLTLLWDAYAHLLPALTYPGTLHASLRAFELILLRQLGHLPDLARHSARNTELDDDVLYTVRADTGVAEAEHDEPAVAGWLLKRLEAELAPVFLHGAPSPMPEALLQVCAQGSSDLRTLLRAVLHYHVGPQPLRTRQLMLDITQAP